MTKNYIPKSIHYCWFGGAPLPQDVIDCINSWKRYCPDYEIIQWNESNYDIHKNKYMSDAYENKKWGFVPDFARLDIVYKYGGIYMDTDVEIIRPIDELLSCHAFAGLEREGIVAFGLGFGAEKGNPLIKEMLDDYDKLNFYNEDGTLNLTPSPIFQTNILKAHGLNERNENQIVDGMHIFATEYFCPIEFSTNIMRKTKNTYSIHHFTASWYTSKQASLRKLRIRMQEKKVPKALQNIAIIPYRISITIESVGFSKFLELLKAKILRK